MSRTGAAALALSGKKRAPKQVRNTNLTPRSPKQQYDKCHTGLWQNVAWTLDFGVISMGRNFFTNPTRIFQ
jgi:hypothetical protein